MSMKKKAKQKKKAEIIGENEQHVQMVKKQKNQCWKN